MKRLTRTIAAGLLIYFCGSTAAASAPIGGPDDSIRSTHSVSKTSEWAAPPANTSRVHVTRPHALGTERAVAAANAIVEDLRAERKVSLVADWHGPALHARGRGFQGVVRVGEMEVEIQLELSVLLVPMRGKIAREIDAYLDLYFSDEQDP